MDSDLMLIFKMRQGDDNAWEKFVRKYYADILKYCVFHCRDRGLAEDLTQEVFLKFFAGLDRYRHQGKAKNYLYTIAANLCRDHWKTNEEISLEQVMEITDDPTGEINDRLLLDSAVRSLPDAFREVIVLHYYQGLKLSEVAAVLKISLPLTKYRLKRGKELLRKETQSWI